MFRDDQSNIIDFPTRFHEGLNQELEAVEEEIIQIKKFLSLSSAQRKVALERQGNHKESLRQIVRNIAKVYHTLLLVLPVYFICGLEVIGVETWARIAA